MLVIWIQSFWNDKEIIPYIREDPTEEDIRLFWNDPDKTKKFVRVEVNEETKNIEKILDVESGRDLTFTPWARDLTISVLADYHD